ncbi:hypothetical protein ACVILL_007482 [Bradyrhizobium sp. USDA 3364]
MFRSDRHLDAVDYTFLGFAGASFVAFVISLTWLLIG